MKSQSLFESLLYVFDIENDILVKRSKNSMQLTSFQTQVLPLQDVSEAERGTAAVSGRGAASTQALLVCIEMCTKVKLVFS